MTTTTETRTHEQTPQRSSRRWMWLALGLVGLLLVAVALATTAGSDDTAYREELTNLLARGEERHRAVAAASTGVDPTNPDSIRAYSEFLDQQLTGLQADIREFEQMSSPKPWKDSAEHYLASMYYTRDSLESMRDATASGQLDTELAQMAGSALQRANVELELAIAAMPE